MGDEVELIGDGFGVLMISVSVGACECSMGLSLLDVYMKLRLYMGLVLMGISAPWHGKTSSICSLGLRTKLFSFKMEIPCSRTQSICFGVKQ